MQFDFLENKYNNRTIMLDHKKNNYVVSENISNLSIKHADESEIIRFNSNNNLLKKENSVLDKIIFSMRTECDSC